MPFANSSLKQFETAEDAAVYTAALVTTAAQHAVAERGSFHWVLAGGSTPELCYRLLRDAHIDWENVHIWFGDERALTQGDKARNETMARRALLDHVAIPAEKIHSIAFPGTTEDAALYYARELEKVACFDLVMLGMGEDGHTASLFPGNPALSLPGLAVPVFNSPKPPAERVSMSIKALNNHRQCIILATGGSKAETLRAISQQKDFPITQIHDAIWIVDHAAWPLPLRKQGLS